MNHGLFLKKVQRVIKFNQNAWLKPYIDIKTDLIKKKKKMILKIIFFKLMNNGVFGKTMENVKKHSDIKLVTMERRRNYLVSEPNCHTTTKFLTKNLSTIEIKKRKILVYLGLLILELSKILMHEFYMIIVYIKKDYIYKGIAEDVETRFDTSNYKLVRPLPKGKIKKIIGLMKDKIVRKVMWTFVRLRARSCSFW